MYYLRDMIGEDAVNRALRKVIAEYAYKAPPYPVSWALVDALRRANAAATAIPDKGPVRGHYAVLKPYAGRTREEAFRRKI